MEQKIRLYAVLNNIWSNFRFSSKLLFSVAQEESHSRLHSTEYANIVNKRGEHNACQGQHEVAGCTHILNSL